MADLGNSIERLGTVTSTQDLAKKKAVEGIPEGAVIIAESQTHGRGRLGRQWVSPSGGLWFSVILRPNIAAAQVSRITLLAAVSIARSINQVSGLDVGIKWPNDILISGSKVAGILLEASISHNRIKFLILGVGINVNVDTDKFPHDLLMPATSLEKECGKRIDLNILFEVLIANLKSDYRLLRTSFSSVLDEWRKYSVTLGKRVKITQIGSDIYGMAIDVDKSGALIIKDTEGKIKTVRAGDLTILR